MVRQCALAMLFVEIALVVPAISSETCFLQQGFGSLFDVWEGADVRCRLFFKCPSLDIVEHTISVIQSVKKKCFRFFLSSPTPSPSRETEAASSKMVSTRLGPKSAEGRNHFEKVFAEAMEGGAMEVTRPKVKIVLFLSFRPRGKKVG